MVGHRAVSSLVSRSKEKICQQRAPGYPLRIYPGFLPIQQIQKEFIRVMVGAALSDLGMMIGNPDLPARRALKTSPGTSHRNPSN
jgi:hypothetical protein